MLDGWDGVFRHMRLTLLPPNLLGHVMAEQLLLCLIRPQDLHPWLVRVLQKSSGICKSCLKMPLLHQWNFTWAHWDVAASTAWTFQCTADSFRGDGGSRYCAMSWRSVFVVAGIITLATRARCISARRVNLLGLAGPLYQVDVVVPKPRLDDFGCVFGVSVLLENKALVQTKLPRWLEEVLLKDLHIQHGIHGPNDADETAGAMGREAPPQHDAATTMLNCGDGVARLICLPCPGQTTLVVLWPNSYSLVSSDQMTFLQSASEWFRWSQANSRHYQRCLLVFRGTFLGRWCPGTIGPRAIPSPVVMYSVSTLNCRELRGTEKRP